MQPAYAPLTEKAPSKSASTVRTEMAAAPSVDIMTALMSALTSSDHFTLVERDGELFVEPVDRTLQ
jgi:hypothetical protein